MTTTPTGMASLGGELVPVFATYPSHACTVQATADGYVVECLHCGPIAEHAYLAAAQDRAETHSKARIPTHKRTETAYWSTPRLYPA